MDVLYEISASRQDCNLDQCIRVLSWTLLYSLSYKAYYGCKLVLTRKLPLLRRYHIRLIPQRRVSSKLVLIQSALRLNQS